MQSQRIVGGGGVELRVVETGPLTAPSILFIHGFSQSWLTWREQLESELSRDFRLVAFDIRGHGDSAKPRDAYGDSRLWADDVDAVIRSLHLDRPTLVGWSYAGFIICDYLRFYGDHDISAINFVGAATSVDERSAPSVLGGEFLELLPGLFTEDAEESATALCDFIRACFAHEPSFPELCLTLGYNTLVPPHVRRALLSRAIDNSDILGTVRAPVLVSQGDRDRIVRPDVGRAIAAAIAGAHLSIYERAGHALFFDDRGRFERELRQLATVATNGSGLAARIGE